MTIRPSPQPSSYTTSVFFTSASFNIAATASSVVGTKGTSGSRRGWAFWAAAAVAKRVAATRQEHGTVLRSRIKSPLFSEIIAIRGEKGDRRIFRGGKCVCPLFLGCAIVGERDRDFKPGQVVGPTIGGAAVGGCRRADACEVGGPRGGDRPHGVHRHAGRRGHHRQSHQRGSRRAGGGCQEDLGPHGLSKGCGA